MKNLVYRYGVVAALALALSILSIGITKDYRLRHEDNNALWTTVARAHLHLGLGKTKGHDTFVSRQTGKANFYRHHPPGIGLTLAAITGIVGRDGPVVVRSAAIFFHLIALILLFRLVSSTLGRWPALFAAMLFAVLPQSAFYGRMYNHEPLAFPLMILLVDRYWAALAHGRRSDLLWMMTAAVCGALVGWVAFFAIAACAVHALLMRGRSPHARLVLAVLAGSGLGAFLLDLLHIAWVGGWDLGELQRIFLKRLGIDKEYGLFRWLERMISFHVKLFTATGTCALVWVNFGWAKRVVAGWRDPVKTKLERLSPQETAEELVAVFTLAGLGYLTVFNWGAWQHHYWQFPLIPAVVISLTLAAARLLSWIRAGLSGRRRALRICVVVLLAAEIIFTTFSSLSKLHTRSSDYCIKSVPRMRERLL
jgi:4-amino-4-deoxy-L-arabinose transferase-like glycosyltransferase